MPKDKKDALRAGLSKITWRFSLIFIPAIVLLFLTMAVIYTGEIDGEMARVEARELAILEEAQRALGEMFGSILSDLLFLSEQEDFRGFLDSGDEDAKRKTADEFLLFCRARAIYDQIRFLDLQGMESIRTNFNLGDSYITPPEGLQSKKDMEYFREGISLPAGEIHVSPLNLNMERGRIEEPLKPIVRFVLPVFDRAGQRRGLLVLNFLASIIMDSLRDVFGASMGRAMLLNRDGFWLYSPRNEDLWGFIFEERRDRTFGNAFPWAWEQMRQNDWGRFYGPEGLFTFANIYPVRDGLRLARTRDKGLPFRSGAHREANYFWKIVSHVPREGIDASNRELFRNLGLLFLLLTAAAGAGALFAARHSVLRDYSRELQAHMSKLKDGLISASLVISGRLDLSETLRETAAAARRLTGVRYAALGIIEDGVIRRIVSSGIPDNETEEDASRFRGEGLVREVLTGRETIMISDMSTCMRPHGLPGSYGPRRSFLGIPLVSGDLLLGVLFLADKGDHGGFTDQDREILETLALHASMSVNNANLYQRVLKSEELYRDLFENANDLIQSVDPEGRFIYVNRAWREVLGYGEEEVGRLSLFDVIHPDSRAHCEEVFRHILSGEGVENLEVSFLSKEGGKIILEGNVNCRFEGGKPVSTRGIFRDVTDRREIMESLQISEERFRVIAASAQDAVISVDNSGMISYWNESAARIFGYREEDVLGRDVHNLLAPERYRSEHEGGFGRWRETGKGPAIGSVRELTALRKDGTEIPIELSLSSVKVRGSWNAIGLVRDITERKRAEAELHQRTNDLDMRVKQIYCLYGISALLEKRDLPLADVLRGIVDLIPPAWQYPEITCARITVEGEEHFTTDFEKTPWVLTRNLVIAGKDVGRIEVCYREARPAAHEGPFLKEERTLLNVITERVGKIIERKRTEEALARAREMEIEIGARIQKTLLLGTPPGDLKGMRIAALTIPSRGIDGDFYDFFRHNDRCVDVIVGDVMGKGIPAALLGAGTKTRFLRALTDLMSSSDRLPYPEEIVQHVHGDMVRELIDLESFVTLCYARFDLERGEVCLVDCGHTKTIHFQAATGQVSTIGGENVPLGIIEEEEYRQVTKKLDTGDVLFFYSDGVTEARNEEGEFLGEERLFDFIRSHGNLDTELLVEGVRETVVAFSGSESFSDDLTCVAVRIEAGAIRVGWAAS